MIIKCFFWHYCFVIIDKFLITGKYFKTLISAIDFLRQIKCTVCKDFFQKLYGLYGFFQKNCTDCKDFFKKKMYGLYGFFPQKCTDCTDFFWKCTDFCTPGDIV